MARPALPASSLPAPDPYARAVDSAIVLARANTSAREAMPLGNGQLGAAVWSAEGMTVQLNRADTLPGRLSPGQVVLPGIAKLTGAADYRGRLDLATGEFIESGAGMDARVYVESGTDALVIDVSGANPSEEQTAELRLWKPRKPVVTVTPGLGVLAGTWQDVGDAGASGNTFGALAAIAAEGSGVHLEASSDGLSVAVRFHPQADGHYRILVAAPAWSGGDASGFAALTMRRALAEPAAVHRDWWRAFWMRTTPLALHSANGEAEYLAQLRAMYLYTAAAEVGSRFPGSHAGIGDLFSSLGDERFWDPAAYWHWNLRMEVAANLSAGMPELNRSYFALYRENLPALLHWTQQHMDGRPGVCVPETMRFNGAGYENERWADKPAMNCGADSEPLWNARTLSTGAEVALWIWRQYLQTDDRAFLEANYPVMREAARFLLAYSTRDAAGTWHTYPANAHEDQWDVHDPITDLLAAQVLYADTAAAAAKLGVDAAFAAELRAAAAHQPPWPLVDAGHQAVLLQAPGASAGEAVLGTSYEPGAATHNVENLGLEAVWPYGLIGPEPDSPLHALGVRTYTARPQKMEADWSDDPLQAAHLGLGEEMRSALLGLTERYQAFPSGMAEFISHDFFVEQIGVLTAALDDALAQDGPEGVIVVAPALPVEWDGDGAVALAHGVRVRVIFHGGRPDAVALDPGHLHRVQLRNPWPGQQVRVAGGPALCSGPLLTVAGVHGTVFLRPVGATGPVPPVVVTGAGAPRRLGTRTLGLFAPR